MTHTGLAIATGCDCPAYPAEVERDCCCIGGTECVDGRRRPPSTSEGMAGGPLAVTAVTQVGAPEPRDTDRGPEVEATGDASPRYYRAERAAVIRLAEVWHGIGTGKYPVPGPLDDAIRAAVALVPVITCRCCGTEYVQGDGRRRFYCSVRCQQRQAKRDQRARREPMSTPDDRQGTEP